MGKAEAFLEWAKGWPELDGFLKLNAITTDEGDCSLNVVQNDAAVERYIDGTAVREFTFELRTIAPWSSGYDPVNLQAEAFAASWQDWVASQFPGNVPDFGAAEVTAIEPSWNVPALNFVYQDDGLAEYLVQAKITYIE